MQLGDVTAERIAPLVGAPAVAAVVDVFSGKMHRLQVILHLEKASNFPTIFKDFVTKKTSWNFSPKKFEEKLLGYLLRQIKKIWISMLKVPNPL
jgi:hypothetical protein